MRAGSTEPARRIIVEPVRRPAVAPAEPAPAEPAEIAGEGPRVNDDDVPLLPGEVLGYRVWRLQDGAPHVLRDRPSRRADAWAPGVVEASCRHGHEAPRRAACAGCTRPTSCRNPYRDGVGEHNKAVYGAVVAWGAIDTTSTDFRAQYVRVVCLALLARPRAGTTSSRSARLARRHGVRCVELAELTAVARDYAGEIPRELRGLSPA